MGAGAAEAGRELLAYGLLRERLEGAEAVARVGTGPWAGVAPARDSFQHLLDSEILRLVAVFRARSSQLCAKVHVQKEALRDLEGGLRASGGLRGLGNDVEGRSDILPAGSGAAAPSPYDWKVVSSQAQSWRELAGELTGLLEWVTVNLHGLAKIMLMYSQGPLAPVRQEGEHTVLEFHHASLPGGSIRQATFLPPEAAREIEQLGQKLHPRLVAAGTVIRAALYKLHDIKRRLGPAPEDIVSPLAQSPGTPGTPQDCGSPGRARSRWPKLEKIVQHANRRHLYGVLKEVGAEIRRFDHCERSLQKHGQLGNSLSFRSAAAVRSLEEAEIHAGEDLSFEMSRHSFPARAGIFQPPPPDYRAFATTAGLAINLASTFLYMASYSVILPPGPDYLTHLGISESFLGVVMGVADLAAILSSFLYGVWTCNTYRTPLLFSSLACLLGCVMSAAAWDCEGYGLGVLLLSRFFVGLGCYRSANRRYIADFVSRKSRTAASSAFVAASSAGGAAGPAFAAVVTGTRPATFLGGVPWNGATGGLLLLAGLWSVFIVTASFFFEDPLRRPAPMGMSHGEDIYTEEEELSDTDEPRHLADPDNSPGAASVNAPLLSKARTSCSYRTLVVCIGGLFVLKMNQQTLLSVLPLMGYDFYGWSDATIGMLLSALSFGMLAFNAGLAYMSKFISDLPILCSSQISLLLGTTAVFPFSIHTPLALFISGAVAVYGSTIVMEAVAMSILSKVIPRKLRRGTFNAGVIASLAGSLGRFVGNVSITALGTIFVSDASVELTRALFASMFGAAGLSLAVLVASYGHVRAAVGDRQP